MTTVDLDNDGRLLKNRNRQICGAKTRKGTPCEMRVEVGKRRCRLHGGLSTGPRTNEGKGRIATAQRLRWRNLVDHGQGRLK